MSLIALAEHVRGPRTLTRTLLIIVVIPAVIWDADQRGIHDKVTGLVLIRA